MADAKAKKSTSKKKPVSAKQATAVANMLKQQTGDNEGGPALPKAAASPVATDNDGDED